MASASLESPSQFKSQEVHYQPYLRSRVHPAYARVTGTHRRTIVNDPGSVLPMASLSENHTR